MRAPLPFYDIVRPLLYFPATSHLTCALILHVGVRVLAPAIGARIRVVGPILLLLLAQYEPLSNVKLKKFLTHGGFAAMVVFGGDLSVSDEIERLNLTHLLRT